MLDDSFTDTGIYILDAFNYAMRVIDRDTNTITTRKELDPPSSTSYVHRGKRLFVADVGAGVLWQQTLPEPQAARVQDATAQVTPQ